ncbi:MAG: response regulator [Clostridia bacterium]|nr:response regulator [Clostridia bacterium]
MNSSTLGQYIRSLRVQKNWTQAALAEKLHVTDKAVSKWERDISFPDITLFTKIADLFGIPVEDLLNHFTDARHPSRLMHLFQITHDVRTPIHIILGCTDLIETHTEREPMLDHYLRSIRISADYLLNTFNRLLEITDSSTPADPNELRRRLEEQTIQSRFVSCNFTGKRILVAEDMALNREIAEAVLRQTGASVEFAEDGNACVEKLRQAEPGHYDLILMDILMPNMDGVEATRHIRQMNHPQKASIPIVAMTASVSDKDRQAAMDAGMNAFTEKPISVEKLFSILSQFLEK